MPGLAAGHFYCLVCRPQAAQLRQHRGHPQGSFEITEFTK
jgi:hypothetical protein